MVSRATAVAGVPASPGMQIEPPWWDPQEFARLAQDEMSARFAMPLTRAWFPGSPAPFDLVSEDRTFVANLLRPWKRHTRTLSPAQRSAISEQVLLLTSVPAQQRALVFTRDADRIRQWLDVHGHLARDVEFWHLRAPGDLQRFLF